VDGEVDAAGLVFRIADDRVEKRVAVGQELDRAGERAFRGGLRGRLGFRFLFLLRRFRQGVEFFRTAGDQLRGGEIFQDAAELAVAVGGDFERFCDLGFGKGFLRILLEKFEDSFAHVAICKGGGIPSSSALNARGFRKPAWTLLRGCDRDKVGFRWGGGTLSALSKSVANHPSLHFARTHGRIAAAVGSEGDGAFP
jgi:hypothetical protein